MCAHALSPDHRSYGELRIVAFGLMHGRLHMVCFTFIEGGIRVISLRKANKREVLLHDQSTAADRR
ncbi:MAG: BrnT family toxin [Rhodocyclaceae bacterium]|nr:BrnT family toxin [Rhodocyclaceae bacterium]